MKTAIVILNWNTRDLLDKYLPLLIDSVKDMDAQVIVADNASDDGSRELLEKKFSKTPTILFDRNWGFTGGYDKALAQIEADYYILMNSDIEVPEGWLGPMVQWMDGHPECGACAPKLHSAFERDSFEYAGAAGGYIDFLGYPFCRGRVMSRIEVDRGQYDDVQDVFWASGACLMIRSKLWKELGGLDERFFAHMEEIDLCWRLQLAGWHVSVVPQSMVWHIGGATLPKTSPWKLYLNFRNNLLMLCNNLSQTYALELHANGALPEVAASKAVKKAGRLIFFRMVLDGFSALSYLLMFKGSWFKAVLKAHKDFRKLRTVKTEEEIISWLGSDPDISTYKVRGIYGRSIIWQSLVRGKDVFKYITKVS